MAADLAKVVESMRLVRADAASDATRLDESPFNGRTVGENFGNLLAMVAAVAHGVELIASKIDGKD